MLSMEKEVNSVYPSSDTLGTILRVGSIPLRSTLSLLMDNVTIGELKEITPKMYEIVKNYNPNELPITLPSREERRPYIPDICDGDDPIGLLPLNLLKRYLVNTVKTIGEEEFYRRLRGPDNEPTMKEMRYAWCILALMGYDAGAPGYTRIEHKDYLLQAVQTADKVLNQVPILP